MQRQPPSLHVSSCMAAFQESSRPELACSLCCNKALGHATPGYLLLATIASTCAARHARQEDVLMRKLAGLQEGNTDCEMAHRTAGHRRNHGMCKPCH